MSAPYGATRYQYFICEYKPLVSKEADDSLAVGRERADAIGTATPQGCYVRLA